MERCCDAGSVGRCMDKIIRSGSGTARRHLRRVRAMACYSTMCGIGVNEGEEPDTSFPAAAARTSIASGSGRARR
jgi:hypothetical protein